MKLSSDIESMFESVFERIEDAKDQAYEKRDSGTVDHMQHIHNEVCQLKLLLEIDLGITGLQ